MRRRLIAQVADSQMNGELLSDAQAHEGKYGVDLLVLEAGIFDELTLGFAVSW